MYASESTRKAIKRKNYFITCGGGDFGRKYFLEDHNNIVGYRVSNHIRRKEVKPSVFLAQNPNSELTGVYNEFGHEKAVTASPLYYQVQIYSPKQLAFLVKKGI